MIKDHPVVQARREVKAAKAASKRALRRYLDLRKTSDDEAAIKAASQAAMLAEGRHKVACWKLYYAKKDLRLMYENPRARRIREGWQAIWAAYPHPPIRRAPHPYDEANRHYRRL